MSWNGSGIFNRLFSWVADKNAGLNISASRMDSDTNDITSNGFNNCLTRDGQGSASANQPMNGFLHNNVGPGAARTDYTRLDQTQDGVSLNWTIAAGTSDALTATFTPALTVLVDGQLCFIRAQTANTTTTPTFAPNSLTAEIITKLGGAALSIGDIAGALTELILRYNLAHTRWELLNLAPNSSAGTLIPTGVPLDYIGITAPAGYVLADGNSIGDASSGATERANADTAALFALIWNSSNQANGQGQLQDSSGANTARGVSAASDFAAHCRILLPDYSDRVTRGKSGFTSLGQTGGSDFVTIGQANLPNVSFAVDIPSGQGSHGHALTNGTQVMRLGSGGTLLNQTLANTLSVDTVSVQNATLPAMSGTAASGGSGAALTISPRYIVQTKIIKL